MWWGQSENCCQVRKVALGLLGNKTEFLTFISIIITVNVPKWLYHNKNTDNNIFRFPACYLRPANVAMLAATTGLKFCYRIWGHRVSGRVLKPCDPQSHFREHHMMPSDALCSKRRTWRQRRPLSLTRFWTVWGLSVRPERLVSHLQHPNKNRLSVCISSTCKCVQLNGTEFNTSENKEETGSCFTS